MVGSSLQDKSILLRVVVIYLNVATMAAEQIILLYPSNSIVLNKQLLVEAKGM